MRNEFLSAALNFGSIQTLPAKCPGIFNPRDFPCEEDEAKSVPGQDVNLPGTKHLTRTQLQIDKPRREVYKVIPMCKDSCLSIIMLCSVYEWSAPAKL